VCVSCGLGRGRGWGVVVVVVGIGIGVGRCRRFGGERGGDTVLDESGTEGPPVVFFFVVIILKFVVNTVVAETVVSVDSFGKKR